jgi:hypothetical protein
MSRQDRRLQHASIPQQQIHPRVHRLHAAFFFVVAMGMLEVCRNFVMFYTSRNRLTCKHLMAFLRLYGEDNDICVLCELGESLHPVTCQTKSQCVSVIMLHTRVTIKQRHCELERTVPFDSWKLFTYTNARRLPNIKYTEVLGLFCSGQKQTPCQKKCKNVYFWMLMAMNA